MPIRIEEGSFHDEEEKTFLFEYDGTLTRDAIICLAMYDSDNPLVAGKNPTVKFDNKNTLSTNRLQLVTETPDGDVNADGKFNVADVVLLQKWLLAVPDTRFADWKSADLCSDNRLDVFDLCMMNRIQQPPAECKSKKISGRSIGAILSDSTKQKFGQK